MNNSQSGRNERDHLSQIPGIASTTLCIPNISTPERRKRLASGLVAFALSLGVLAVLILTGVAKGWRIGLLLLFWGATTGFFQWRDHT
jgi:hypothetical protein